MSNLYNPQNRNKMPKKEKTATPNETFNMSTVWPNQVIAAHKVKGDAIGRIAWDKPKDYGDKFTVRSWSKYIDISVDKNTVEIHPACIEVLNVASEGWMGSDKYRDNDKFKNSKTKKSKKSKKKKGSDSEGDDDEGDGWDPKIPFKRSTTFTRKGENGEDIVEHLGECMWILRNVFNALIQERIKMVRADKEKYAGEFLGKRSNIDPFKEYRPYNSKYDKNVETIEIDDEEMVKIEDPVFKVGVSYNKKTGDLQVVIKDVLKAKKKKGVILIPDATLDGIPLTKGNVGDFISKGSLVTGTMTFDTVKSHKFGLSQPFEIGWRKVNPDDEKSRRILYVKRRTTGGVQTKMNRADQMAAMLEGEVAASSSEDEDGSEPDTNNSQKRTDAKTKAQKEMISNDESDQENGKSSKSGKSKKSENPKKSNNPGSKKSKSSESEEEADQSNEDEDDEDEDDEDEDEGDESEDESSSNDEESSEEDKKSKKDKKDGKSDKSNKNEKKDKNEKNETKNKKDNKSDKKGQKDQKNKKDKKDKKKKDDESTEEADSDAEDRLNQLSSSEE